MNQQISKTSLNNYNINGIQPLYKINIYMIKVRDVLKILT
jgi:hypothetical protein